MRRIWFWVGLMLLMVGGAGAAWLYRGPLFVWHWCRPIAQATPEGLEALAARLAPWGEAATARLTSHLGSADEATCRNAAAVLAKLTARWGPADARSKNALEQVLNDTSRNPLGALLFADALLRAHGLPDEQLARCRSLAQAALRNDQTGCRLQAVRLAMALGMFDQLPTLLSDPVAEVRALAVLALGIREDVLATDDLLPLLHDADAEVRSVCEQALRSRGLPSEHVALARMVTDPQAAIRAGVPARVFELPDLDTAMWMERLVKDPSPAVRVAAIRMAVESGDAQWNALVSGLAECDPSPTVKQIARYYLTEWRPD